MANYVLIVLSNPTAGKEEEFRRWYLDQHIPDCLRVPGIVAGKLLPAAPQQHPAQMEKKWDYMAMFDIDTDNIDSVLAELSKRMNTSDMPISDAFSFDGFHIEVFAELD